MENEFPEWELADEHSEPEIVQAEIEHGATDEASESEIVETASKPELTEEVSPKRETVEQEDIPQPTLLGITRGLRERILRYIVPTQRSWKPRCINKRRHIDLDSEDNQHIRR